MSPDEALSDTDRRCKHMIRYPHECRDCEAEACDAHRASGEGGSPSVLRTSAPEGQDATAITVERVERIQSILAEAIGLLRNDDTASPQVEYLAVMALDEAMHLLDRPAPPQADAKANLARAPHSLAPEEIDALDRLCRTYNCVTLTECGGFIGNWMLVVLQERRRVLAELR